MLPDLVLGSLLITVTVVLAAIFGALAIEVTDRIGPWLTRRPHRPRVLALLIGLTLWVQASVSLCIWIWAVAFRVLGLFDGWEPAVYFAIVSFTTLGFGDIILDEKWRVLSGFAAANGLLMFGLFTAFLVEMIRRIHRNQIESLVREE